MIFKKINILLVNCIIYSTITCMNNQAIKYHLVETQDHQILIPFGEFKMFDDAERIEEKLTFNSPTFPCNPFVIITTKTLKAIEKISKQPFGIKEFIEQSSITKIEKLLHTSDYLDARRINEIKQRIFFHPDYDQFDQQTQKLVSSTMKRNNDASVVSYNPITPDYIVGHSITNYMTLFSEKGIEELRKTVHFKGFLTCTHIEISGIEDLIILNSRMIKNILKITSLTLLAITHNPNLEIIDADTFDTPQKPLVINLSHNPKLTHIEKKAFKPWHFGELDLTHCQSLTQASRENVKNDLSSFTYSIRKHNIKAAALNKFLYYATPAMFDRLYFLHTCFVVKHTLLLLLFFRQRSKRHKPFLSPAMHMGLMLATMIFEYKIMPVLVCLPQRNYFRAPIIKFDPEIQDVLDNSNEEVER
jgi:hypothetical protein